MRRLRFSAGRSVHSSWPNRSTSLTADGCLLPAESFSSFHEGSFGLRSIRSDEFSVLLVVLGYYPDGGVMTWVCNRALRHWTVCVSQEYRLSYYPVQIGDTLFQTLQASYINTITKLFSMFHNSVFSLKAVVNVMSQGQHEEISQDLANKSLLITESQKCHAVVHGPKWLQSSPLWWA